MARRRRRRRRPRPRRRPLFGAPPFLSSLAGGPLGPAPAPPPTGVVVATLIHPPTLRAAEEASRAVAALTELFQCCTRVGLIDFQQDKAGETSRLSLQAHHHTTALKRLDPSIDNLDDL
eukprot:SM000068S20566  [mRNA]  locus=s68:103419:109249:- [translate_table: standard]